MEPGGRARRASGAATASLPHLEQRVDVDLAVEPADALAHHAVAARGSARRACAAGRRSGRPTGALARRPARSRAACTGSSSPSSVAMLAGQPLRHAPGVRELLGRLPVGHGQRARPAAGAARGTGATAAPWPRSSPPSRCAGSRTARSSPSRYMALSVPALGTRGDREVGPLRVLGAQQPADELGVGVHLVDVHAHAGRRAGPDAPSATPARRPRARRRRGRNPQRSQHAGGRPTARATCGRRPCAARRRSPGRAGPRPHRVAMPRFRQAGATA